MRCLISSARHIQGDAGGKSGRDGSCPLRDAQLDAADKLVPEMSDESGHAVVHST